MKFDVKLGSIEKLEADALAVFLWKGEKEWSEQALWLDSKLGGLLKKILTEEEFEAEAGKILTFHTHGKINFPRIIVVGLGEKKEFDLTQVRNCFALLGRKAKDLKIKNLGLTLSFAKTTPFNLKQISQGVTEGLMLGTYKFLRYKSEKEKAEEKEIETVGVGVEKAQDLVLVKEGIVRGEIFSQATIFARDLVNEPASVTTPSYLNQVAKKLVSEEIKCQVYDKIQMEKMGLGGVLGIAKGSDEPPKFIRLEYKPKKAVKKVILVGKTVTFDSGGLSLKPSEAMGTMKSDMAGGAAVLGVFSALSALKPKVWVIGLMPAVENMPSGRALKPGDILKARNGKTIEIANTDAEGRVILADALALGVEEKPDLLIDLATLTGACMVALGEKVAGIFGTDKVMVDKIEKTAIEVGEAVWPMPLVKDYQELLKSEIADLRNISTSKYGGAITAALFLKEFVDPKTPWVHLDIAGPAFNEKDTPFVPQGGSGFGVRTLLEFLISNF